MKVTKARGFEPITIVIETEKEAKCLWHRLNHQKIRTDNEYLRNYFLVEADVDSVDMWQALSEIYRPRR